MPTGAGRISSAVSMGKGGPPISAATAARVLGIGHDAQAHRIDAEIADRRARRALFDRPVAGRRGGVL